MIRWNPSHNFQNRRCLSRVRDNPHWCHQWRVRDSCSVVASAGTNLPIPTAYNSTSKYNKHLHNISTPEVQQTLENFATCNPNPSTPFIRVLPETLTNLSKSQQGFQLPTFWISYFVICAGVIFNCYSWNFNQVVRQLQLSWNLDSDSLVKHHQRVISCFVMENPKPAMSWASSAMRSAGNHPGVLSPMRRQYDQPARGKIRGPNETMSVTIRPQKVNNRGPPISRIRISWHRKMREMKPQEMGWNMMQKWQKMGKKISGLQPRRYLLSLRGLGNCM